MKHLPQLLLGVRQNVFLPCGQCRTGSINVKIQHGHRRLKRRAFAAMALQRGTPQRKRDLMSITLFENIRFQVQRVALPGYGGGPAALWFGFHA